MKHKTRRVQREKKQPLTTGTYRRVHDWERPRQAWRALDGRYWLSGDTWAIREWIKARGGEWVPGRHAYLVDESVIATLGIAPLVDAPWECEDQIAKPENAS